jgi:feruloyl esterase
MFEVWMPEPSESWNGRFQAVYNGGFSGAVPYSSMAPALKLGYSTAATDTGHEGTAAVWGNVLLDASWAPGHPEKVIDFGYRGVHEMTVKAKAITQAFYGKGFVSYWTGCSGGGRAGVMEAQRYPEDYDGILAGDPTIDFTHLIAGGRFWEILSTEFDLSSYIPDAKVATIYNAVSQACSAYIEKTQGFQNNVLTDPRECRFDPASIQCPDGTDATSCLTGPQVEAVRKIYKGPGDLDGKPIYFGYMPGGELDPGGWGSNVTGLDPYTLCSPLSATTTCPGQWDYAESFFQSMVFDNTSWDFHTWNYATDMPYTDNLREVGERLADVLNGENANLEPFKRHGGKLIHYHGWSDIGVSPLASIDYFERAQAAVKHGHGDPDDLGATRDFYRLFMIPGMHHCTGGPGTDTFDGLTPLVKWVEEGVAPESIVATHVSSSAFPLSFTRPLCPYPEEGVYSGSGDPTEAANFVCRFPKGHHHEQ